MTANFYPRPPRGGRRRHGSRAPLKPEISIHALREEGDVSLLPESFLMVFFSIHALREVGDNSGCQGHALSDNISIHALREEGDYNHRQGIAEYRKFLSTPSARRATKFAELLAEVIMDFYPRPPRGGRPAYTVAAFPAIFISIHALREEGDPSRRPRRTTPTIFLSTPSARRAT